MALCQSLFSYAPFRQTCESQTASALWAHLLPRSFLKVTFNTASRSTPFSGML